MSSEMESRIARLEAADGASVPGTTLSRCWLEASLFAEYDLGEPPEGNGEVVWGLWVGGLCEPKQFVYGRTMAEAVEKMELKLGLLPACDYCEAREGVVFVAEVNTWFCPACLKMEQDRMSCRGGNDG